MSVAPRWPGLRPGQAAETKTTGLGHPLNRDFPPKSQYPAYLRRQRHVETICRIPRLVGELLDEIARHYDIADDIDARLEKFAGLDLELLRALGADVFPARPLHVIGGGS
jgi:hypothetical protein